MNLSPSLIIAVAVLISACGLKAQPTLSSTNAAPQRVAVVDFTIESTAVNTRDWSAGLEDYFEMALEKQNVAVLERRNIRLVLGERGLQSQGLLSAESLSQARLPSVNCFISGTLASPAANEFALSISVVRADKAEVVSALTRRGAYPTEWLPAIDSLAREVGERLQVAKPGSAQRSEFEMMTWLPEAALPFFKGLDFFGRGDYAAAIPWFRESYGKDRHFEIARRWEARTYRKLGLGALAQVASGVTNIEASAATHQRPVVAIVVSERVPAAGRAAFVQALLKDSRFELFDPTAIGATAREIDLQLTGQMAAPINERSVWLVVDDVIYLDAPEPQTLAARQQSLLSGEMVRQAGVQGKSTEQASYTNLARELLKNETAAITISPGNASREALPEPGRLEPGDTSLPKALRLVQAEPDSARRWIGLADVYGGGEFKSVCLDEAVAAVGRKRDQPDAAFWLSSALWRKRDMTRRVFYEPTPQLRASNPLTNDFAILLQWFPQSREAVSLAEVTNHGEGSFTYVDPADRRCLAPVYTNYFVWSLGIHAPSKTAEVPPVTDTQRFARLDEYLRSHRNAPAWQLANTLRLSGDASSQAKVHATFTNLLESALHEREQFKEFSSAVAAGNPQQVLTIGQPLLKCIDWRQRAEVINQCGEAARKQKGAPEQLKFLFSQARQYREDFVVNPETGVPEARMEYQLLENSSLVQPIGQWTDFGYKPLMGVVAEITYGQPPSELTKEILTWIRNDPALPLEKQLTAAFDLALWEEAHGHAFEALEMLKEVLRQTEGTAWPLRRNNGWSQTIESAASDALRKVRIYTDMAGELCDCCGKAPEAPLQKPANYEEMNRKLEQLWRQMRGEAGTNHSPVGQQLLEDKGNLFPVILYKLRAGEEISHMMAFCRWLGTNALPALPLIIQTIHRGEPFEDYNNALSALGGLGQAAGCAKPLLILARENAENSNFAYALKRIGPAPRRVMPLLAQLLYHKDPEVCKLAAKAIMETASLGPQFQNLTEERQVAEVRKWWEETGSRMKWEP